MASSTIKKGRNLLWTNPNGSLAENAEITLSSSQYNYLLIEFRLTWQDPIITNIVPKGSNIRLFLAQATSDGVLSNCLIASRNLVRTSDTKFTAELGYLARLTGQIVSGTNFIYPTAIYGID